jgi:hypothetical protein
MRWLWLGLAVLAGVAVAAAVWLLGAGPAWRSPPGAGELEGFSPDSTTVVTSLPRHFGRDPEVCRWNAVTGRLLGRTTFPCADPKRIKPVRPSADGRKALVGEGEPISPPIGSELPDFGSGDWYLHDGITGKRLAGPIRGVSMVFRNAFSLDGRWALGFHFDPGGKGKPPWSGKRTLHIFSATGEVIAQVGERDGSDPTGCLFAPNGDSAAICWGYIDKQSGYDRPTFFGSRATSIRLTQATVDSCR